MPGGLFLNNDVVTVPGLFKERFEALWYRDIQEQERRKRGVGRSLGEIQAELQERFRLAGPHRITSLGTQLSWLSEAGFQAVDCLWKYLDLAIAGGVKNV